MLEFIDKGMRRLAALAVLVSPVLLSPSPAAAEGDAARGKDVFSKCAMCHTIGPDARNSVGPALNGVTGAPAASRSGYNYSRALNDAGQRGLVWTDENLDSYLANPRQFLTGGRMAFAGLGEAADRADVIAYLRQFAGN